MNDYSTFTSNTFQTNRQGGGSGSCDALNVRDGVFEIKYYPDSILNAAEYNNNESLCSD